MVTSPTLIKSTILLPLNSVQWDLDHHLLPGTQSFKALWSLEKMRMWWWPASSQEGVCIDSHLKICICCKNNPFCGRSEKPCQAFVQPLTQVTHRQNWNFCHSAEGASVKIFFCISFDISPVCSSVYKPLRASRACWNTPFSLLGWRQWAGLCCTSPGPAWLLPKDQNSSVVISFQFTKQVLQLNYTHKWLPSYPKILL